MLVIFSIHYFSGDNQYWTKRAKSVVTRPILVAPLPLPEDSIPLIQSCAVWKTYRQRMYCYLQLQTAENLSRIAKDVIRIGKKMINRCLELYGI